MKLRLVRSLAYASAALMVLAMMTSSARGPASVKANPRLSQARLLSGSTELALQLMASSGSLTRLQSKIAETDFEIPTVVPDIPIGGPVAGAGVAGGPANVVPQADGRCSVVLGGNVKVNQDCENASDPAFHGRGQAQNEPAIAANPFNSRQVIASANDYRRGDGSCGGYFSQDGGRTWNGALMPIGFVIDPNTHLREYFEAGGDTAVGWDSSGTAYFLCQAFSRGAPPTNNPDANSAIYVFRSDNKGASWNFPASRGGPKGQVTYQVGSTTTLLPLADKPMMAVDANPNSPNRDNIYVSWTLFASDGTANIYVNRSRDHGESWDGNVLVSTPSTLCPLSVGTSGSCDANQFSQPVVAPNGDLYVAWDNYNNAVAGADNRNQILLVKSTDGGHTFGPVVKVADYYDLPSCYLYTHNQDFGRACVPVKAPATVANQPSVFRATNYPSMVVDPKNSNHVIVNFGSYINAKSKESNGCVPNGFGADGNNAYDGVNTPGACNNDILVSTSTDGGTTFTGTTTDPRMLPSVTHDSSKTDKWWQWTAIDSDGRIAISYYDRRYGSDETTGNSDISLTTGNHAVRVTSSSMPPPTQFANGAGHSLFYGDYAGVSVAEGRALPIWSDTRDVGITSCPTDVRQLCSFGNDQDVFTALKSAEQDNGGDGGGGQGG